MAETGEQIEEAKPVNEVGVVVEALERIGIVSDKNREEISDVVTSDFEILEGSGKEGINYPWIPDSLVTLDRVIQALNDGGPGSAFVDGRLWTPGENPDGYSTEDLALFEARQLFESVQPGNEVPTHMRVAVHNPDNPEEPLLHFLSQSFDEFRADEGEETQLTAIEKAKQEYEESQQEDFTMIPLNAKGLAIIALMQQIKGEAPPLDGYELRDATLPRLTMMGIPLVGDVRSDGTNLRFISSFGFSRDVAGVGLSAGPKAENLQGELS